jgi:hypothetical protein
MTSSFVQNNRNAHAVHVESGGFGEFTNNDLRGNTLASWSPNTKPPRMNIKESGNLVDNGTQ